MLSLCRHSYSSALSLTKLNARGITKLNDGLVKQLVLASKHTFRGQLEQKIDGDKNYWK